MEANRFDIKKEAGKRMKNLCAALVVCAGMFLSGCGPLGDFFKDSAPEVTYRDLRIGDRVCGDELIVIGIGRDGYEFVDPEEDLSILWNPREGSFVCPYPNNKISLLAIDYQWFYPKDTGITELSK